MVWSIVTRAQHRAAPAPDQHLGPAARRAREAVGIAGAQDGDHRVPGQRVGAPVADGGAARQALHDPDPRVEAEDRLGAHLGQQGVGCGRMPNWRRPTRTALNGLAPGIVSIPALLSAWTKSSAGRSPGAPAERREEAPPLLGGERGIVVGAGEVGEDAGQAQVAAPRRCARGARRPPRARPPAGPCRCRS